MNEERAVLDFFAKVENLPLGIAVADQVEALRQTLNTRFWQDLQTYLQTQLGSRHASWRIEQTEDRHTANNLVGLHCLPAAGLPAYLHPMLEQQFSGGNWRIYAGVIWSTPPSAKQLSLPEVTHLQKALQQRGFRSNENLLGWQWTPFHPRRKDFLLHYTRQPGQLLEDTASVFISLLIEHETAIAQANAALHGAPSSLAASLNGLRNELTE